MKTTLSLTLCLLLFSFGRSQQQRPIFSFESEEPEKITHIFINLNFNKVSEIPAFIGDFKNLRELTFFAQSEFFLEDNWKNKGCKGVDIEPVPLNAIPDEIGQCRDLEILQIVEGNITTLPASMKDLDKLRVLHLPDLTPLDSVKEILADMESLERLVCFSCEMADDTRSMLRAQNPEIEFLVTEDDLYRAFRNGARYVVDINQNCGIVYGRVVEAIMFIDSMPEELRKFYNVSLRVSNSQNNRLNRLRAKKKSIKQSTADSSVF